MSANLASIGTGLIIAGQSAADQAVGSLNSALGSIEQGLGYGAGIDCPGLHTRALEASLRAALARVEAIAARLPAAYEHREAA